MVMINEWTDRVYQNTPQEHIITNVVSGRKMRIQKFNLPDTGEGIGWGASSAGVVYRMCVTLVVKAAPQTRPRMSVGLAL